MSEDKRGMLAEIFIALMIFTGLVWVSTVAFIISWPWEKSTVWKPGFAYSDLADARARGLFTSLTPAEPAGDIQEEKNWLKWKIDNGVFEVKASSWHFQTTIRYRVEGDTPVLIEYQDVAAKAFYYGIGAALFALIGIYLRKLRR